MRPTTVGRHGALPAAGFPCPAPWGRIDGSGIGRPGAGRGRGLAGRSWAGPAGGTERVRGGAAALVGGGAERGGWYRCCCCSAGRVAERRGEPGRATGSGRGRAAEQRCPAAGSPLSAGRSWRETPSARAGQRSAPGAAAPERQRRQERTRSGLPGKNRVGGDRSRVPGRGGAVQGPP